MKVWQQFLLVTSSKPACRCLLYALLHIKRWKRGTFLHATKEIGDVNPGYLPWVAMVGKIQPDKRQHTNYLYFIF